MSVRLDTEQARVVREILRAGRDQGANRTQLLAALDTAAVEANYRNPSGGDRDSSGWRQERASSYPGKNRMNVYEAATRFFQETRGQRGALRPGALAQAAQRSAFPGRYALHTKEAAQLLRQFGAASRPRAAARQAAAPTVQVSQVAGTSGGLSETLARSKPVLPQGGALPDPVFSGSRSLRMAGGMSPTISSAAAAKQEAGGSLSDRLRALAADAAATQVKVTAPAAAPAAGGKGGKLGAGTEAQRLAREILANKNIQFASWLSTGSDRKIFEGIAAGHLPYVPHWGKRASHVNLAVLRALAEMGRHGQVTVNAFTGGVHSSEASRHYRDDALDLDLGSGLGAGRITRIAGRFGGSRNSESDHIHLDF